MKKENAIFIIEPERIVGLELQVELEKIGFTVVHAHSLKESVYQNYQRVIAVIVNTDKIDVNKFIELKEVHSLQEVPIITISTDNTSIENYKELGLKKVFFKPFSSKEIAAFIDKSADAMCN